MKAATTKKRPRLQFHLSTCVVMMVMAGLGIWINMQPTQIRLSVSDKRWGVGNKVQNYVIVPTSYPAVEPCTVHDLSTFPFPKEIPYLDVAKMRPWKVGYEARFGWPRVFALNSHENNTNGEFVLSDALETLPRVFPDDVEAWDTEGLAMNVLFWAQLTLFLGVLFEIFLRSHARKRLIKETAS